MNGRIYDPTLGRFLQADPFIQAPTNSQSYNRYAYVFNNPLSYTDPSGYSAWTKFRDKILKPIVAIAITVLTSGSGLAWAMAGGAMSGYVMTGSLKGALIGAFSGALFHGAGDIIAGGKITNIFAKGAIRGMAGGISSVLSGGKFGHGFAAAGFTSMAGGKIGKAFKAVEARVIASAVVGGTISRLTGGKFANGAITAAFMSAYNDANHPSGSKSAKFDGPLGDWFRSIGEGAAAIRGSIENGLSEIGNSLSSLADDPMRTTANVVAIAGSATCLQTAGVGCYVAATAATIGASDMLEQTTGMDPVQRGTEKGFMAAGMDAESARKAAAISVSIPGAISGAGQASNMMKALSVNQAYSVSGVAGAYLSAYSVNSAQKEVSGN
jgi:hypothetical protein